MATRTIDSAAVNAAVQPLNKLGVNLLALDFDETLIGIHTHGCWPHSLQALVPHVRPEFRDLLRAVIASNIHVAIVTLSCQPSLIKGVLEELLGDEQADKIPVRGGDGSWSYTGTGSKDGKQAHLASALEELHQSCSDIEITKGTTLLIDDDHRNIRIALNDGFKAIWLDPSKPENLLQDIANMVCS